MQRQTLCLAMVCRAEIPEPCVLMCFCRSRFSKAICFKMVFFKGFRCRFAKCLWLGSAKNTGSVMFFRVGDALEHLGTG